jgi:hypothetical protein
MNNPFRSQRGKIVGVCAGYLAVESTEHHMELLANCNAYIRILSCDGDRSIELARIPAGKLHHWKTGRFISIPPVELGHIRVDCPGWIYLNFLFEKDSSMSGITLESMVPLTEKSST